jgi:hypothetical protein
MRRLWATAASGAVLLLSAGCSTEPAATGAPTPAVVPATPAAPTGASTGASAGPNAGDVALAGNTPAICSQAAKVSGQAAATFAADLKQLVDASTAKDKNLAATAKAKVQHDVEGWSYALGDLANLVADAKVKKALGDMSAAIGKLKGDVEKIDEATLTSLRQQLDQACGAA